MHDTSVSLTLDILLSLTGLISKFGNIEEFNILN